MFLSAAAVRADYQSTVLGDNPLAFYALNPAVDGVSSCPDLTGNGNTGAAYNITVASGPSPYISNAAGFDGADAAVDLSMGSNPGLLNFGGPITMEAWVQSTNTTQGPADIIGKGYDSSQNYDEIALRANGGVNYYGGTYNSINGGGSASGGQQTTNWTYLVSTYDGTNWNLYVNGKLAGQGSDTVGAINFSDPWRIGTGSADGTTRYFMGNISEVALYNIALRPDQVLNHFYVGEINSSPSNSAPIIVAQPQPQTTFVGGTVTFSVGVVSAFPTTNQWFKNNVPMSGKTNASLTLSGVSAGDAVNYSVVVGNGQGTTNSVQAGLTLLASGNSLKWSATGNSGVWDTANSANWIKQSNSQQVVFNANDQVLFDDTVGVPTTVTVNGTVSPSVVTVNSSTNNYTFGGSGSISGTGSLVKQGSSTLTIVSPANFTGPVSIAGGTIYAGDYSFQSVASVTVTNNATLDFGGSTYDNGQTLTISGTGVNGEGALYNSIFNPGQLYNIVLAGDATIGCASGSIWGLNGGSTVSGPHKLTIKWGGSGDYTEWNGVVFAANSGDMELASGKLGIKNMGSNFGNPASTFTVDAGAELDFWTSDFGYAKNYHVFGLYQILTGFTTLNANYTLENGCQFTGIYGGGNQTITGTVALNGTAHMVLGDGNFIFTNVISGPGGFVWDAYNHQMILQASNTYTGPTVIGGGQQVVALSGNGSISHSSLIFFGGGVNNSTNTSVDVSGRSDQTLTLASGQTLGGIGQIKGSLVVSAGATIAPAGTNTTINITTGSNPTGTLAATGSVGLNGATTLKLDGSGVNDQIQAGAGITYGGTLNLENISGAPYAAGNSFQIFSAGSYGGSFAGINPATPGAGLAWDTSQLNIGFLNVVAAAQPVIGSTTISGTNLIFSGGGGTANGNYAVITTTNLSTPLTNWKALVTNSFNSFGNFSVTNAISTGSSQRFYSIKSLP
jgi:autotransporter-associated beta strand protein